jgi:hypothetical protein
MLLTFLILYQDTINTDPQLGMGTTLGSYALKSAKPKGNAAAMETVRVCPKRESGSLINVFSSSFRKA